MVTLENMNAGKKTILEEQAVSPRPFHLTLFNTRNRKMEMASDRCTIPRLVRFYEVEFFPKTGGLAIIDGTRYPIRAGTIRFHRPGQLVCSHIHYVAYALRMTLDGSCSKKQASQPAYSNPVLDAIPCFMSTSRPEQYTALYNEMLRLSAGEQAGTSLLLKAKTLQLLHLLYEDATRLAGLDRPGQPADTVSTAMQFMADNLTQPLQLDDIAAAARLSPYHFHRVFSNTVSLTPQAYLTGLRIEKAKELLLTTELTISEIAAACGFSQPAYFSRVFREQAGLTPTSFREKHQTY